MGTEVVDCRQNLAFFKSVGTAGVQRNPKIVPPMLELAEKTRFGTRSPFKGMSFDFFPARQYTFLRFLSSLD
jgi:hypothetical protein